MALEIQDIQEILKSGRGRNQKETHKAILQEQRLQLHGETVMERSEASFAVSHLLELVSSILPDDKYRMFLTLLRFPAATVSLLESIYTALEKIFDGRNPVWQFVFESQSDEMDWKLYRKEVIGSPRFWETKGFEMMKTSINAIVIVDLSEEQETPKPEPYFYFLELNDAVSFEVCDDNVMEYIMFHPKDDEKLTVLDDTSYRVFKVEKGTTNIIGMEPLVENPHELGYCPARFFWSTPITYKEPIVKKSPVSTQLGKLDMLLFFYVSNDHLNLYGRYPIYSGFASDCDFRNEESGHRCDRGYLKNSEGYYLYGTANNLLECPLCSKKRFDGPGSFVEFDPPNPVNGNADLRNPVQITTIDRASLDYNNEDIDRRSTDIYSAVTGFYGMSINDKSINEQQVRAIFESLEAALTSPQLNFEQIIEWAEGTVCLLRYGATSFKGAHISLGTEHFLMSPTQIMEWYSFAKKSAFSVSTLDMLEDRYFETEYKHNPEQLMRQKVLTNLDPFRHLNNEEVTAMFKDGAIEYNDYMKKINFSSFIARFERENMRITNFGTGIEFDTRIDNISIVLDKYAEEMQPEKPEPEPIQKPILEPETE